MDAAAEARHSGELRRGDPAPRQTAGPAARTGAVRAAGDAGAQRHQTPTFGARVPGTAQAVHHRHQESHPQVAQERRLQSPRCKLTFRALSEHFQSIFRALLEHF